MSERTYIKKMEDFSKAVYDQFILKKDFWFGKLNGKNVAFCEHVDENGMVKVYVRHQQRWQPFLIEKEILKKIYPNLSFSSDDSLS